MYSSNGDVLLRAVGVMYVGNQRFDSEQEAQGYLDFVLDPTVDASPDDRVVSCTIDWYYNDAGSWMYIGEDSDSITLPGSGPNVLNLVIDAFIPYEYITVPWDPLYPNDPSVAEGDNRSFQYYGASARATTTVDLLNPAYNDSTILNGPNHATGLSVQYEASTSLTNPNGLQMVAPSGGSLTDDARNDWIWESPLKRFWGSASTANMSCDPPQRNGQVAGPTTSQLQIHCAGTAYYPFHSFAPPLEWDVTLTFTFGSDQVAYTSQGCRTMFPAFETYGNHYAITYGTDSGNPMDLFRGCAQAVNDDGVIR